ncbi:MAG TPA: tRNA adenosine(34) deaminase TadA [Bacillota bacterium]|nr:tRNA adenosine(34) deaminase TadA [Bacillota bacterium]
MGVLLDDNYWMGLALEEAKAAYRLGEVPVGAVLVLGDELLARAHNLREATGDPTAHAEILAMREAGQKQGGWRLTGTTLYVTVEPCIMCAGALVWARVARLVYGTPDPKAGAVDSLYDLVWDRRLNHRLEVTSLVRAAECRALMQDFFRQRRDG